MITMAAPPHTPLNLGSISARPLTFWEDFGPRHTVIISVLLPASLDSERKTHPLHIHTPPGSGLVVSDSATPWTVTQPDSSVRGILQVRILEWVAISSSRGSSWPRDRTQDSCISCTAGWFSYRWATGEVLPSSIYVFIYRGFLSLRKETNNHLKRKNGWGQNYLP